MKTATIVKFAKCIGLIAGIPLTLIVILWTYGAIQYLPSLSSTARGIALCFLSLGIVLVLIGRTRVPGFCLLGLLTCSMLLSFFSVQPRTDREWEPPVAKMPVVERLSKDLITIKNVRNFRYKTETDFIPEYYDKTVDLNQLSSVDIFVSYWAGDELAHIMVSFGFAERDFLAFSIETRKEASESYSTFAGFYRNYELMYLVADERDVIGLRTNIRSPAERVHLLRTKIPPDRARKLFLQYVAQVESLTINPEFYNTLTTNCTTQVLRHVQSYNTELSYNWKVFLSGYVPEYLYELNSVDTSKPFEKFFSDSKINDRANRDTTSEGFSQRIREGLSVPLR